MADSSFGDDDGWTTVLAKPKRYTQTETAPAASSIPFSAPMKGKQGVPSKGKKAGKVPKSKAPAPAPQIDHSRPKPTQPAQTAQKTKAKPIASAPGASLSTAPVGKQLPLSGIMKQLDASTVKSQLAVLRERFPAASDARLLSVTDMLLGLRAADPLTSAFPAAFTERIAYPLSVLQSANPSVAATLAAFVRSEPGGARVSCFNTVMDALNRSTSDAEALPLRLMLQLLVAADPQVVAPHVVKTGLDTAVSAGRLAAARNLVWAAAGLLHSDLSAAAAVWSVALAPTLAIERHSHFRDEASAWAGVLSSAASIQQARTKGGKELFSPDVLVRLGLAMAKTRAVHDAFIRHLPGLLEVSVFFGPESPRRFFESMFRMCADPSQTCVDIFIPIVLGCLSRDAGCFEKWQELHPRLPSHSSNLALFLSLHWDAWRLKLDLAALRRAVAVMRAQTVELRAAVASGSRKDISLENIEVVKDTINFLGQRVSRTRGLFKILAFAGLLGAVILVAGGGVAIAVRAGCNMDPVPERLLPVCEFMQKITPRLPW